MKDKQTGEIEDIPLDHGAVLDIKLLDRVVELRDNYRSKNKKLGSNRYCYLLSNILYFEDGSKFSGTCANGRSNKYRYYKCKGLKESILAEELQDRIIALLFKYIESDTRLQEIISDSYKKRISNVAECDRNIRGLESQIKEQDKRLFTLYGVTH